MGTYAKSVLKAGIAATADTWDEIGSVELPAHAKHVHGFLISYGEATKKAAEAVHYQLKWNSPSNGIGDQIFNLPKTTGGAPATNVGATGRKQLLKGMDIPVKGNSKIKFWASSHAPDPTEVSDFAISVLFNDGNLSEEFKKFFPSPIPGKGSDAEAIAAVTATTETAITALDIQGWAKKLVSFDFGIAPDAEITAGDPVVPVFILRSSFPNFDPQEYVGPSLSGILGTATGNSHECEGIPVPIEIDMPVGESDQKITPHVKLTTTSATDIAAHIGVDWK